MAITINGNGTITGVSVGGLPDGVVDRDTLSAQAKGTILQVINGSTTSSVSITSATFAEIGLSASITPSSSSNKILVFGTIGGIETSADNTYARGQLLRASTAIISSIDYGVGFTGDTGRWGGSSSFSILDSPSTTSATTYTVKFNNPQPSGTVTIQTNSSRSSIVLMEVVV